MWVLTRQLLPDKPVAPVHDAPDERRVRFHRLEVAAAPEDQCLSYGILQAAVALLGNPVLVGASRVGARRLQSVVVEYGLVALVERATTTVPQIVSRSRQLSVLTTSGTAPSSHSAPWSPLTSAVNVSPYATSAYRQPEWLSTNWNSR